MDLSRDSSGEQYNDYFDSVATMFLYMVAELSALQQVLSSLTGIDPLPVMIVEVAVTTIYTCENDLQSILIYG